MQFKSVLPYMSAVFYSLIFGLSFLFTKKAILVASTFELLALRFLVAFLIMSILVGLKVIKVNYKNKPMKDLVIASIAQPVIYFILEAYAIKFTSSSYVGLFIALIPITVPLLAIYFLKEMPSKSQWIFIVLSVAGVFYIILNDFISANGSNIVLGTIFLFGAITAASFFNIFSKKLSMETDFTSFEMTYFMNGMGALTFNTIAIIINIVNGDITNYFKPLLNQDFLISIIYLGFLSSVVAYYCMVYSLSKLSATKATVFANLSTIISIIGGVIFLKEKFYSYHVIGSIIILIGIIGTNLIDIKSKENFIDK